jgi:hypothetical protein
MIFSLIAVLKGALSDGSFKYALAGIRASVKGAVVELGSA